MKIKSFKIMNIPAIMWGNPSNKGYIFVHGSKSRKEEAESFAMLADERGYQTLSFDLPAHGERKAYEDFCNVITAVEDLKAVYEYASLLWKEINLVVVSLGAYFSLLAYKDSRVSKCLFVSPVLDMAAIIQNMMKWFNVTKEELIQKKRIATHMGETLDLNYYNYVLANPIEYWPHLTEILYPSMDNLTSRENALRIADNLNAHLTVYEGGEHYFHTEEQLKYLENWFKENI